MTLSFQVIGGGVGYQPTIFSCVQGNVSAEYALSGTPTTFVIDRNTLWTVTPNPLAGSSSNERWISYQILNGTGSVRTMVFQYHHQYELTMQTSPLGLVLNPGSGWQDSGKSLTITASPNKGYGFSSWNGTGAGSYTGSSQSAQIIMNGPINETANYYPLLGFPLSAGWNLVSLPLVPKDSAIKSVLSWQISADNLVSVWSYTGTGWQTFIPGLGGSLKTMADGKGYWIFMRTADTLYVDGNVIVPGSTPPTYPLVQGWNLVGFKPQPTIQNEAVSQYLTSIAGGYDQNNVWIYDNISGAWIRADSNYMLQPGQAMWILMTAPATLRP